MATPREPSLPLAPRDLPVKVVVTDHARERARERFPGFKAARISDEVRLAMRAGRISANKPPFIGGTPYSKCLYVWNEAGNRAYACKAADNAIVVCTTYSAAEAA